MAVSATDVQKAYLAYFGRPADPVGLAYWMGQDAVTMKAGFAASVEYATLYAGMTSTQMVAQVYTNLLGREADVTGLLYWSGEMAAGRQTVSTLVDSMQANVLSIDIATIANRVTYATAFTAALDTTAEIVGYSGTAAATAARTAVSAVVHTDASLTAATAALATSIATVVSTGTAATGSTFTLSTAVDNYTGGTGNDTFTADNTATTQAGAADTLNGGAGTDTLTIYGGFTTTTPAMTSIELVNVDSMEAGDTWNFGTVTGITTLTNSRAAGAATVTVNDGTAVTVSNNALSTGIQTVNFGATDTSVNLTLNKMVLTGATDLVVTGAAATTLNINTTGAASSIAQKIDGDALMTKLVVTGDQNLTIGTAGTAGLEAAIVNVDANAFTGKLAVVTGNTAAGTNLTTDAGLTVTGGSGDDTINVSLSDAADNVVVVTGAGTNTVRTLNANLTATEKYTGGAGTDTLQIDFANTTATQAVDMSALITGFETIEVLSDNTGAQTETLAMATNKLGISNIVWSGDAADSFVITGAAAASTVTLKTGAVATDVTIGTDTAADTVSVVLDGTTTTGLTTLTSYETVNLTSQKDTAGNTNVLASLTAASATSLVLTGAAAMTGATVTLAATAAVNASAYTGDLTATTFTAIASYAGGTGKDEITTAAGGLKQGVTYAGGAGADKLTSTATSAQDAGILALTGFETVVLGTHATAGDAYKADFRNVTDLTTLTLNSGDDTDTLTLNRLSADTTVTFNDAFGATVTTLNTGTSQKFGFSATVAVASLTLDSGTTAASIATADTFTGTVTTLSGTSLATLTVTGAGATTITNAVGTTVTKIDASAATGALTVTASATATTILGGTAADAITGGAAADTITGGAGGDTLVGGAGADTYVFAATGALNGADVFAANIVGGVGGDILNFAAFLSGGTLASATATEFNGAADVQFADKVIFLASTNAGVAEVDTAAEVAALIQGAGNALALTSGGKGIIIAGDDSAATAGATIYFVNDALDGVNGTVSATDVVIVGTATLDIDTLLAANNFAFA